MLKCEIGKNTDCRMMAAGSTMEIVDDILNIIKFLFNHFQRRSPAQAKMFRENLVAILQDPESPIFDGSGEYTAIDLSRFQSR